jgi:hypothetical protein
VTDIDINDDRVRAILETCKQFPAGDVTVELAGAALALILAVTHDKRKAQRKLSALTRSMKRLLVRECDSITKAGRELRAGHA